MKCFFKCVLFLTWFPSNLTFQNIVSNAILFTESNWLHFCAPFVYSFPSCPFPASLIANKKNRAHRHSNMRLLIYTVEALGWSWSWSIVMKRTRVSELELGILSSHPYFISVYLWIVFLSSKGRPCPHLGKYGPWQPQISNFSRKILSRVAYTIIEGEESDCPPSALWLRDRMIVAKGPFIYSSDGTFWNRRAALPPKICWTGLLNTHWSNNKVLVGQKATWKSWGRIVVRITGSRNSSPGWVPGIHIYKLWELDQMIYPL